MRLQVCRTPDKGRHTDLACRRGTAHTKTTVSGQTLSADSHGRMHVIWTTLYHELQRAKVGNSLDPSCVCVRLNESGGT